MNDTTLSSSTEQGLRSAPGIRWLLLAGALVSGVSVFRLVQSQWASIPVPLQFLILVAAALALFGLGTVTRRRLRLPYAGSALLFLFTGLVPVLAWGAAYLNLLDTPSGWLAFSAGGAALLGAAVRVLRAELHYRGALYPAALGLLFVAQPLLPWLGERIEENGSLYAVAALLLGVVLHAGSRHVNRFFFHRDRKDGVDRPLHLVPFLLLGVLYLGALSLLDLWSDFLALPLAVLGLVLVSTGEEYYRALAASLGRVPERWPGRSIALLALGFSLVVAAVPLSLRDSSKRCLPLVCLFAAGLFLRWSLRYGHRAAHAAGVAAALAAWHFSPAASPFPLGWEHVGSLAGLLALGAVLNQRRSSEDLRQTHGALIALYLFGLTALAWADLAAAAPFLGAALALTLAVLPVVRRIEPAVAVPFVAAALVLPIIGDPFAASSVCVAAAFVLGWVLASRFLEAWLGRICETSIEVARQALLMPAATLAVLVTVHGVFSAAGLLAGDPFAGIELALAGFVFLIAGLRTGQAAGVALGALLASVGLHAAVIAACGGISGALPWLALITPAFLAACALGAHKTEASQQIPLQALAFLHGAFCVAACLIFTGPDALLLALVFVAVEFLVRRRFEGQDARAAFPARLVLLPLLQGAVLTVLAFSGDTERYLVAAFRDHGFILLPALAAAAFTWRILAEALGRRGQLENVNLGLQAGLAAGFLLAFSLRPDLPVPAHAALIAVAAAWAVASFSDGRRFRHHSHAWLMQAWGGLAVLHAFTAGWLHFGSGLAPYVLLGVGAAQYALGAWFQRTPLAATFAGSCRQVGLVLPLAGGAIALENAFSNGAATVWFPALAAFLVSLFFTVVASREGEQRVFPALASAAFLGAALLAVLSQTALGREFYFLAPGFALLSLAWLLRAELGPAWSRHVTAAGASCVYATPIVALSNHVSWGWLAALLVVSVTFGAASFSLRSRSLLTVSTAALLTDLGFFVFQIGTTAPTLLWVLGLTFGLTLMAIAAWLEYRREGVLQQIRVFGRELQAWS